MGVVKDQFKTNLFLSNSELDTIAQWKYKVKDNSLTTYIMTPVWDWLLKFIPQNVAPNVLTLAALGCVLQAFWVVLQHGDEFPRCVPATLRGKACPATAFLTPSLVLSFFSLFFF